MHKIKKHQANYKFITAFVIILVFGTIMLGSASLLSGINDFGDPYYYLKHQLIYGIIPGAIFLLICTKINYKFWQKIALPLFVTTILLLILVLIPQFGYSHSGAKRWLNVGIFSIQPSEIAKLAVIFFFATWCAERKAQIKNFYYTLLPFVTYLGIIILLIVLEPDIGTLSVIIVSILGIYWVAGAKIKHIGMIVAFGITLFAILITLAPYRLSRITAFFHPKQDTLGISYQINQSLLGIGSGGIFGLGFGQSKQKYLYLPEAIGDSIFAIIAEELGFITTSIFILLYLYMIILGYRISARAPDTFARLTATGISTWLAYQGIVNIGAMVNIVPLTGLPLPFVSYGSSSLIVSMVGIGTLINISKHTKI